MNRASFAVAFLGIVVFSTACIKRSVNIPVTQGIREARTASLDDILQLLAGYEKIRTLSSTSMRVTFSSGRLDSGKLQEYHSAPGYVLLRRPDSIRLNVQNPVTKTTILELLSQGDGFSVWYPRENKFFVGRNSAGELELEGQQSFSARPAHMFEAILPPDLSPASPDERVAFEEDRDATTKYYVVSLYRTTSGPRLAPVRRLWIDRLDLSVARLVSFDENGARESIVQYATIIQTSGFKLPLSIRIERPIDGYLLEMRFRDWRVNPELPESAFIQNPPEGAERVVLREKGRSLQN